MTHEIKKIKVYPQGDIHWNNGVYLGMSMNNMAFKNEILLREIIRNISDNTDSYYLLVGDYLHRYNEQIYSGFDEEFAIQSTKKTGNTLVNFFKKIADEFPSKYTILYTHELVDNNDFDKKYQRFVNLYTTNSDFFKLINYTIDVFLRRQKELHVTNEKARELCRSYLIEELVIFEILAEKGLKVNIYPGNQLPIMKKLVAGKLMQVSEILEKIQIVEIKLRPLL
jgi:tRNA-dependent cyclodipeptide synthase